MYGVSSPPPANAQKLPKNVLDTIESRLNEAARKEVSIGRVRIDSVAINSKNKTLQLFANMNCAYIPFREKNVADLYQTVRRLLPESFSRFKVEVFTHGRKIEEWIPQAFRSKADKKAKRFHPAGKTPLKREADAIHTPTNGLYNRHIAMWQSHGFYYEAKLDRWEWQRARIFQTVEDLYTQSYVLPYLVPMLENAGANVLLPRTGLPKRRNHRRQRRKPRHTIGLYRKAGSKKLEARRR